MLCTCEDRNARVNRSVFCSSSTGRNPVYIDVTDAIARHNVFVFLKLQWFLKVTMTSFFLVTMTRVF